MCSSVLFLVISRANVYRSFTKDGDLGLRLISQLAVARRVYETEGKRGLGLHLELLVPSGGEGRIEAAIDGHGSAHFPLRAQAWPQALAFLTRQTNDRPVFAFSQPGAGDHWAHLSMMPQVTALAPAR